MKKWRITTQVKDGIRDVQGEAVLKRFWELGYHSLEEIHVGQVFFITGEYEEVLKMCQSGLVNTKLYHFALEDMTGPPEDGVEDEDAEFERTSDDSTEA